MRLWRSHLHLCNIKAAAQYHTMRPNTCDDPAEDQHNLRSSITLFDRDERVILKTSNFIVINKPFDVRMNGDFSVTVEKLLVHWFPNTTTKSFKFVHELDYATSGAVCIALNKDAAAIASSSFANRLTHKTYLAVLQGHLDISKWPLREERRVPSSYISQPKKKAKTEGNSSGSALRQEDDSWQTDVMNENLSISHNAFAQLLKRRHKDDESLQQQELIDSLESVSIEQFKNHSKLRKSLRKALRANGIELALAASVGPLVAASDDVEETLPAGDAETNEQLLQQSAALSGNHPLPHEAIYRIKDPTARGGHKLIVSVPIAELTGDFRCVSAPTPLGKECETEVEVLHQGMYGGLPVTKVAFKPITGRRHQLRVHSLRLGHPIVGDVTYSSLSAASAARSAPRMMLHALSLDIPVPFDSSKYLGGRSTFVRETGAAMEGGSLVSAATADPFPVDEEGVLQV